MNRIVFYIVNFITQHNSALNKDYSHNYHMERKKLDKHTSECSYEIIMIFHTKLLQYLFHVKIRKTKNVKYEFKYELKICMKMFI